MTRTYRKNKNKDNTYRDDMVHLRCLVSKRLRKKKLSKNHIPKNCWTCW